MKLFTKQSKQNSIDTEVESVIATMSLLNPDTEEYTKMADNLHTLMEARSYKNDSTKISKDVIFTGILSIVSILIIVGYEQANVLGSKAVGFVNKGRV